MKYRLELHSTKNINPEEEVFESYPDKEYIKKLSKLNRPAIYALNKYNMPIGVVVLNKSFRAVKINYIMIHRCYRNIKIGYNLIKTVLSMLNDDFCDVDVIYTVCPQKIDTTAYQKLLLKLGFQVTTIKANGDIVYTYAKSI